MAFNAEKVKNEIVEWIRAWFEQNGPGCNAVLGISGGKDSSVTAALCAEALGRDKVIGVLLPNGEQFDIDVSKALCEHLKIKNYVVNIKDSYNGMVKELESVLDEVSTGLSEEDRAAFYRSLGIISENLESALKNCER